jgi:hypothetical protein
MCAGVGQPTLAAGDPLDWMVRALSTSAGDEVGRQGRALGFAYGLLQRLDKNGWLARPGCLIWAILAFVLLCGLSTASAIQLFGDYSPAPAPAPSATTPVHDEPGGAEPSPPEPSSSKATVATEPGPTRTAAPGRG